MEDLSHPLSQESLSRVLTGFVVTFIHALWAYLVLNLFSSSSSTGFLTEAFSRSNFFIGVVLFLAFFLPFAFLVLYYVILKKQSGGVVWKLFFTAEIPLFAASWLVVMTQFSGFSGVFLYLATVVGVVGYSVDSIGGEQVKTAYNRLITASSVVGSGVMTYAFVIWSFFFVAIMSQFGVIFASIANIITDLFTQSVYSATEVIFPLLYILFVVIIFMSPLYLIGAYWHFLSRRSVSFLRIKNEKIAQVVLRIASFVGVFALASMLNGSVYSSKHSPLQLQTKADFTTVYESKDLKALFVNAYRNEIGYLGNKSDSTIGFELFCYGDSEDTRCAAVNNAMTFLLTPFLYQRDVVVSYPSNVSSILEKAYDGKIPSSIDVNEIIQAVQRYAPQSYYGYDYYEPLYMPPIRPEETKQVILRNVINDTVVSAPHGVQQSTLYLEFDNLTSTNQESQLLVHLPAGTVITGLKLGEDLEMTGIVAPKGAANTVYENSVVRRIDPALVTQVGPSTYSLKVFPIFPNRRGGKTQRVQITYSAPATNVLELPTISSITNTDIDYKSMVKGTVTVATGSQFTVTSDTAVVTKPVAATTAWGAGYSFSWSFDQFTSFLNTDNRVVISQKITPYCVEPTRATKKAVVYLDISLSSKKYRAEYETFINGLVGMYDSVSIVTFNAEEIGNRKEVTKDTVSDYVAGVVFWGNSSNSQYSNLLTVGTDDEDAYMVTDADTYAIDRYDDVDEMYDYSQAKGKLFVAFANGYKPLPEQVRYVATAKGGDMLSLSRVIDHTSVGCLPASTDASSSIPAEIAAIRRVMQLNRENNKKLLTVTDHDTLVEQGRKMYVVAGRNGFVDILNSLIALETDAQMQQLRTEIEKNQAFDSSVQSPVRIMRDAVVGSWAPTATKNSLFGGGALNMMPSEDGSGSSSSRNGGNVSVISVLFAGIGVIIIVVVFVGLPKKSTKAGTGSN